MIHETSSAASFSSSLQEQQQQRRSRHHPIPPLHPTTVKEYCSETLTSTIPTDIFS
jgi:hypothetical protein